MKTWKISPRSDNGPKTDGAALDVSRTGASAEETIAVIGTEPCPRNSRSALESKDSLRLKDCCPHDIFAKAAAQPINISLILKARFVAVCQMASGRLLLLAALVVNDSFRLPRCVLIAPHFKEINQLVKTVSLNRKKICTRPDSNSRDGAQRRRSRNHSAIGTSTALHPPVVV